MGPRRKRLTQTGSESAQAEAGVELVHGAGEAEAVESERVTGAEEPRLPGPFARRVAEVDLGSDRLGGEDQHLAQAADGQAGARGLTRLARVGGRQDLHGQ